MSDFDIRSINLNLLPALEALLAEQNVSAAARRAHVSQSAMSHSLARLRELLGDPLLVPLGRGLTATPRAREIAAQLPRALDQLSVALAPPAPFDPRTSTRAFRVATLDYFELTALPALLSRLRSEAPRVSLEIERFTSGHLAVLAAGELDLALVGEAVRVDDGAVKRRVLFDEPFRVIARPDHPEIGRRLDLATYVRLGHVLVSVEGRREGVVDRALSARGLSRRVALRVPHFTSAPLAVLSSDWIGTVASAVATRAAALFGVRNLAPPLLLPTPSVVALWPKRLDEEPGSAWFRALVLDGLERASG